MDWQVQPGLGVHEGLWRNLQNIHFVKPLSGPISKTGPFPTAIL